jgi:hypothetical protein
VDKGIFTGDLIRQGTIEISKHDNFITYPLHQYGVAVNLMKESLMDFQNKKLNTFKKENVDSNLYYHPSFIGYLYYRFFKGVK